MNVSLIMTVLNEERTITTMLQSISEQSYSPNEVIIVDGGSVDATSEKIKKYHFPKSIKITLLEKKGNRSVGRNEAIRHASGEIIACSDAGCILDRNWLREIINPFSETHVDVVAGYYQGKTEDVFQQCIVPYVLVMPDRVNPQTFLPATRSMAFRKKVWQKVKGFDERFSHNEDFVFAKKIKRAGYTIVFTKDAIVYWLPPKKITSVFRMFFRFALGDAEAKIYRPKVVLLFLRYLIFLLLLLLAVATSNKKTLVVLFVLGMMYVIWSVQKNYRYVGQLKAIVYLPFLQIVSDVAVLGGTILGIISPWAIQNKQ